MEAKSSKQKSGVYRTLGKVSLLLIAFVLAHWGVSRGEDAIRQNRIDRLSGQCDAGIDASCLALADMYLQGRDGDIGYPFEVDTSPMEVAYYLASSCQLGNADSCLAAGEIVLKFGDANIFFERACELESNAGCEALAAN